MNGSELLADNVDVMVSENHVRVWARIRYPKQEEDRVVEKTARVMIDGVKLTEDPVASQSDVYRDVEPE